jgi:AcrR family transcriptional regulator
MVIDTAVELLEQEASVEAVTLAAVAARLGVRAQSLYAHVDGLDGLRRDLAVRALRAQAEALSSSVLGRAGADAIEAIVLAYVDFALCHPGLYEATLRAPGDDAEVLDAVTAVTTPLNLVFRSYGLDDDLARHWYRFVFAAVHGFTGLRRRGLYTLPGDPDETLQHMIRSFTEQLERDAARPKSTTR